MVRIGASPINCVQPILLGGFFDTSFVVCNLLDGISHRSESPDESPDRISSGGDVADHCRVRGCRPGDTLRDMKRVWRCA